MMARKALQIIHTDPKYASPGSLCLRNKIEKKNGIAEIGQCSERIIQLETVHMLLGELLADRVHAVLDASLQFHRNGLGRTVVVTQIPAEHGAGKRRRSLDGLNHRNNLVVGPFFGFIVIMAVPIMEPVSLELNKI